MASLNMEGSYVLTIEKIDDVVTKTSPGNYAIGYVRDETFYVYYIGRSDDDVNERLNFSFDSLGRYLYGFTGRYD